MSQRKIVVKALIKGKVKVSQLVKKGIPEGSVWHILSILNKTVGLIKEKNKLIVTYSVTDSKRKKLLKLL